MVNKVNGQKYYEYTRTGSQKRKSAESSEFHLNQEHQGVIYEKSEEKKQASEAVRKEEASRGARQQGEDGVRIEISHQGQERAVRDRQRAAFAEQMRKFAETAVSFLKALWDRIWNDKPKETEFPEVLAERIEETEEQRQILETHPLEEKDSLAWSIYTQEEVRAIFKRGNQKEIQDFLSEHGERHLAKNSDLLTQYDRSGSIVGLDRSDKERILHGDRNEIGL
ncbi:MAG: hypothetical protein HFI69_11685 [Lachnospiraceae bacterium]|nr:hypothetical protein [Lachnospiraceae bacterium]